MDSLKMRTPLLMAAVLAIAAASGVFVLGRTVEAQPAGPVADKAVAMVTFDDATGYPSMGIDIGTQIEFRITAPVVQRQISVTSWDMLRDWDPSGGPLDSIVAFYVDIPKGCWARWWDPQNAFPMDIKTNGGYPAAPPYSLEQLGREDLEWTVKKPGDVDIDPPSEGWPGPQQTFELDLHFQTSQYGIVEMPGQPIPITRFLDFHCEEPSLHRFWVCNKIEPLPPYWDPQFPPTGLWPGDNVLCMPLDVTVWADADLSIPSASLDPQGPYVLKPGVPKTVSLVETVANAGPYGPVDASVTVELDVPANCWGNIEGVSGMGPTTLAYQETVAGLGAGATQPMSESIQVACYAAGQYDFTLRKDIDPVDPHVVDPGPDRVDIPIRVIVATNPEQPTFSIKAGSPDAQPMGPYHPADILMLGGPGAPPVVAIPCFMLGLVACGPGGPMGPQDDIDSISWGMDWISKWEDLRFATEIISMGLVGSAVRTEATKPVPEQMGDEFQVMPQLRATLPVGGSWTNVQVLDEDGSSAYPFGLRIGTSVDALDDHMPAQVLYFTLAPGSPTLAAIGASPGDILMKVAGMPGPPMIYASAAALGLRAGDSLDGLCLLEDGVGGFSFPVGSPAVPGDRLLISLAPGSPTLVGMGWSAADVLQPKPAAAPAVFYAASKLGLLGADNVTAMKCIEPPRPTKLVCPDLNGDGFAGMSDVLLVAGGWSQTAAFFGFDRAYDLNNDGSLGMQDVLAIAAKWSQACAIPLP